MQLLSQSKITNQVHTTGKKRSAAAPWNKISLLSSASVQINELQTRQNHFWCGVSRHARLALASSSSPDPAEQMTLAAAGLCAEAVLGTAAALGSWTTSLEAPCRLGARSFQPSESLAGLGPCRCVGSPRQRSLEVLSARPVGMSHAELTCVAMETGWAFPHLTARPAVCLLHHTICSRVLLCVLTPTLFNCVVLYHLPFLTAAFLPVACMW